jgi:5-methylcytosine-specific restriction protein B
MRVRLLARGVELRDRLDAQSIVWWLINRVPPASWNEADGEAFKQLGGSSQSKTSAKDKEVANVPDKAWLVRGANVSGVNLVPQWIEQGYISIGWYEVGDLDPALNALGIWEKVKEAYPDDAPGASRASAGNLNRFLALMRPGHLVLTADGDKLFVGRITSDATFDSALPPNSVRRRSVDWLNESAPASRAEIQVSYPTLFSKLRTLLSVTDLKEDAVIIAALAGLVEAPPAPGEVVLPQASDELAQSLHLPKKWLQEEILDLLAEKRQLIFYGPPGTGKTFVAQRIAEYITRSGGEHGLIQFHPSYSYEDFFEGYRPAQADGGAGVTYELTPGPLRRFAETAAADSANPYVLIIDEINRGNIAKIFGELFFLLEYREAEIPLQYSPDVQFGLPKNLYVIGTMNTADRSIALVDTALRRRFYFVGFMPRENPIRDVLANWLEANELGAEPAILMRALNDRIETDEVAIGPSYFITPDGREPNLERIWKHAILPVLEEHYYGTGRDVRAEFGLKALRSGLDTTPASSGEAPSAGSDEPSPTSNS